MLIHLHLPSVMPPGVLHIVVSATDCVAEGGHFYLSNAFHTTMQTRRFENKFGHFNTNTEHIGSELILHATVQRYCNFVIHRFPHLREETPSKSLSYLLFSTSNLSRDYSQRRRTRHPFSMHFTFGFGMPPHHDSLCRRI